MIPRRVLRRFAAPLGVVLLIVLSLHRPVRAEVSIDPSGGGGVTTIVMGIGDGPDPFSPGIWQIYRSISNERILNASGTTRGDGRPDLVFAPATGWPLAVWAYVAGADRDVAFSEWDGSAWTPAEFLTSGSEDDLDPRVTVAPDGTIHAVWWRPGAPDAVYLATREPGSPSWSLPIPVTSPGEIGRRPSVAVASGVLYVAYERPCASGCAQEIVVAERLSVGAFVHVVVGATARTDRLDAELHAEAAELWVEWKDTDGRFGIARLEGGDWSGLPATDWPNPTWVGVEDTRRTVRRDVLLP